MNFYGNEFLERNSTPLTPKRKVAVVRPLLSSEGSQVAEPNAHLCSSHELLGADGNLPATFAFNGNLGIDGLHYPFFAPSQEADVELVRSCGRMNPSFYQNDLPLGCTRVSAGNPEPQGPMFVGSEVSPDYHRLDGLQHTISTAQPQASSSSSASTTPEPATPSGSGDIQAIQLYEADVEPPLWPALSAMKLEPQALFINQIELPELPEGVINRTIPADSGPSSELAGVDRRRSSTKKASRAPKQPKPYTPRPRIPCTVADCRVTFQDERARNRHIRSVHNGTRYFCPGLCKATGFSREDALTRHLRNLEDESECKKTARMLGWDPRCKGSVNNLLFLSPGFDA